MSETWSNVSIGLHVKYPLFLSDFNKSKFFDRFKKKSIIKFSEKSVQWEMKRFRADRWTDSWTDMTKLKHPIHSQLNWAILLCDVIPDGKNWVNCAVLTGNSADLRTVLSSHLWHRELRSSLREPHSFLSLPADTTIASSQGTSVSSNSFSRWASHDIFLFKYHFLLHILRFLFFFSDNIIADVASKQQTTALFLSTIVTRTRRHTELTKKKLTSLMGNLCCAREHSVQFFVQFCLYPVKLHSLT